MDIGKEVVRLKAEAEQTKWQMLFTLAGQGYNSLIAEFAAQLNAGMDAAEAQRAPAGANGEDKAAAPPRQ